MHSRTIRILSIALLAGLVLWGIFSTIVYLGVPVHGAVYLTQAAQESIGAMCDGNALFCRGVYTLVPMVLHTLGRAGPFLPYVILTVVIAVFFIGGKAFKTGRLRLRITLRPLTFILLFLLSLWLIFTTLSYQSVGGTSIRRLAEPLPGVYQGIGEEGLQELQNNYHRLLNAGCLDEVGKFDNGARVYQLTTLCMQKFFVTRVFSQFVFLLFILFEMLILGRLALQLVRFSLPDVRTEALLSVALGACLWVALLWFLAVVHLFVRPAVLGLFVVVPIIGYQSALYWLKISVRHRWNIDEPIWSVPVLLGWLLVSYLALNFLTVIRPFPIGWDDLGSYLNRPNLLVSYGSFIHSMAPFQWEYLTAVGFALFGFGSPVGAAAAMVINWSEGLLAVLALYAFGREYFGPRRGLLTALLYYTLPLVGHFSYADMKIDNAVFTMGALATYVLFRAIVPPSTEDHTAALPSRKATLQWVALAGVFTGFAFGMKVTAVMVLMALLSILAGVVLHWTAFFGAASFAVIALTMKGGLDFAVVGQRLFGEGASIATTGPLTFFAVAACVLMGCAFWKGKQHWKNATLSLLVFVGGFLGAVAPWIYHDNLQRGRIIPVSFDLGAPNKLSAKIDAKSVGLKSDFGEPVRTLPPELAVDAKGPACSATGHREEIDRYWGFRIGWSHYLTLPWRTVLNIDSTGYYVTTMPALFLFPLLFLIPFFWRQRGKWLRWMFLGTVFLLLEWMFMANGIPWYGIGVFLGLVLGIEALIVYAPDTFSLGIASVLVTIAIMSNFAMRLWQFEQQRNLFEYPLGKASAEVMRERTVPDYDDIAEIALQLYQQNVDRPYLYRVGTFIPYFIPKNLEVIGITDHQLDVFNCLYQERDAELTTKRLKTLGFSSIIFDTNTATIERDPNGSLHQKVQAFVDYLNDPKSGLQLVINDPEGGVAYLLIP